MTDGPQIDPPAICVVCGTSVAPSELAPELTRLPQPARLPIHRACLQSYLKESRARGAAWARSPRGRWTLGWLRMRLIVSVVAVSILSVLAAGPAAIVLAIRGTRLRRAVCSAFLGRSRAVVIVGYRAGSAGAAEIREAFSASWGDSVGMAVCWVDIDAPLGPSDIAGAAWQHWGNDPKPPGQQSVVVIPRHGAVKCLRIGHSSREPEVPWRDRLLQVRGRVQVMLDQPITSEDRR